MVLALVHVFVSLTRALTSKCTQKKIISAENYIGQSSECRMHLLKLYAYTMNTNNAKRSLKLVIHL